MTERALFRDVYYDPDSFVVVEGFVDRLPKGCASRQLAELFAVVRDRGIPLFGAQEPVGNEACRLGLLTDSFYMEASHNSRGEGDMFFILRTVGGNISSASVSTTKLENGIIFVYPEGLTASQIGILASQFNVEEKV